MIWVLGALSAGNVDVDFEIARALTGICSQGDAGLPGPAGIQVGINGGSVRLTVSAPSSDKVWFVPFQGTRGTQRRIRFSRKTGRRHERTARLPRPLQKKRLSRTS